MQELVHTATGYLGTALFFGSILLTYDGRLTLLHAGLVGTVGIVFIAAATIGEMKRDPEKYHDLMNIVHQARYGDKHDMKQAWNQFNGD